MPRDKKRLVLAGLLLGILIASMDNTIVNTAMGTIVAELGGLEAFTWVTSAYLIASVAGMPIWGKLSDMFGRKLFYMTGLGLFMLGSLLCGTADNIVQLSIYRAVQGLGGGACMPIAFTIIFDIYPPEERGKISGWFGAVFGLSSIFGPLLGAYLTDFLSWHWVFFVNLPLGMVSLFLLYKFYYESLQHRKQRIDWEGAFLLLTSIISLMFALQLGGKQYAWTSWPITFLLLSFALNLIFFLRVESRAAEPIMSLQLFRNRLFAATQGTAFFYGTVFVAAVVYIPIYVQGVLGGTARSAGFVLLPMMLGSVAGSQWGGRKAVRSSYRHTMLVSLVLFLGGILLLTTLSPATPRFLLTLYMILTGLGVGVSFSVLSMSSIHEMEYHQRGSANSAVAFFRTLGMTLGLAVFAAIQSNIMLSRMQQYIPTLGHSGGFDSRTLLQPAARAVMPPHVLEQLTAILSFSIGRVFACSLLCVLIAGLFIIMMGDKRLLPKYPQSFPNEKAV